MIEISLIISTYNRSDALELVLQSVLKQQLSQNLTFEKIEVIIADDGSNHLTAELIRQFKNIFPYKLIHIWHEDNGFRLSSIRNLAVSKSKGKYLIFIDGDCLLAKDFILNHFMLAEPNFVIGGNRVLISENYTKKIIANKDISITNLRVPRAILARITGKINKFMIYLRLDFTAKWRKKNGFNWQRPKGCNLALWRDDFIKINGFDEDFTGWGHEDADFIIRLLHAGLKIKDGRFAVPVYHLWHRLSSRHNEADNIQILKNRLENKYLFCVQNGFSKYLK